MSSSPDQHLLSEEQDPPEEDYDPMDVPRALAAMPGAGEEADISVAMIQEESETESFLDRIYGPYVLLIVFTCVAMLNYIDRGLIGGIMPGIRVPVLHCTETESGTIAGAFTFGYMIAAPIFSIAGKWIRPTRLMALGQALWIVSVFFAGSSRHFWPLLFARIGSGIGEASFAGLAPPIIDDNAPKDKKTLFLGIFFATIPVGTAAGFAIGGVAAVDWLWYGPFFIEGLVMVPFVLVCYFVPVSRSASDKEIRARRVYADEPVVRDYSLLEMLWKLAKNPLYIFSVVGYAAYAFVLGALAFWVPDFFVEVLGMRQDSASVGVGIITIVSGFTGVAGGGWLLDRAGGGKGTDGAARSFIFCAVFSLVAIPWSIAVFGFVWDVWVGFSLLAIGEVFIFATQGAVPAHLRV